MISPMPKKRVDNYRESKVEDYLDRRVIELGGITRKIRYIGRRSCPDRLVLFPDLGMYALIECKRPATDLTFLQEREAKRLSKSGLKVYRCRTYDEVDDFIAIYA